MTVTPEQLKELMKVSDTICRKFFFSYRTGFYLPNSQDLNDLKSEGYEAMWEVLRNEKYNVLPFDQLKKICFNWVRFRMMKIKLYSSRKNPTINNNFAEDFDFGTIEGEDASVTSSFINLYDDMVKMIGINGARIILERDSKKKTFDEIAENYGCTKQWAHYLYSKHKRRLIERTSYNYKDIDYSIDFPNVLRKLFYGHKRKLKY